MQYKSWIDGLDATGPDWYFDATFNRSAKGLIAPNGLPGYQYYAASNQRGLITQAVGCHHWYIDSDHFEPFVHSVVNPAKGQNVWTFACILFEENQLQFRRGLGFGHDIHTATEMTLMRSLLATPTLQLTHWQISAGGNGYSFKTIARGHRNAELDTYLINNTSTQKHHYRTTK